jgi:hypothetical protein
VQTGKGYAALIVEPHYHTAALRVDASVIRRGDPVAVPAAGDNEERFECPRLQAMTNISDHLYFRLIPSATPRKPRSTPGNSADVRDLRGVIDREKAAIGILISLQPPTGPMETEAASAGFYDHKLTYKKYPRLQLRTVKELMEGKGIERPSEAAAVDVTFKKAPQSRKKHGQQKDLGL